jgi:hypothetical protein
VVMVLMVLLWWRETDKDWTSSRQISSGSPICQVLVHCLSSG